MTPEKKVKMKVVAILKEVGAYYFYPVTGGYGASGVPDIVGCFSGRFSYAHEFETASGWKITPAVDFFAQTATFASVDNAEAIRDLITERLRKYRDSGLGGDAKPQDTDSLSAAKLLLSECRALRSALL